MYYLLWSFFQIQLCLFFVSPVVTFKLYIYIYICSYIYDIYVYLRVNGTVRHTLTRMERIWRTEMKGERRAGDRKIVSWEWWLTLAILYLMSTVSIDRAETQKHTHTYTPTHNKYSVWAHYSSEGKCLLDLMALPKSNCFKLRLKKEYIYDT